MDDVVKLLIEYGLVRDVAERISRDANRIHFRESRIQPFENISKYAMDVRIPKRGGVEFPGWNSSLKDHFAFFCWCRSYYVPGESALDILSAYLDAFVCDNHMSRGELDNTIKYIRSNIYLC